MKRFFRVIPDEEGIETGESRAEDQGQWYFRVIPDEEGIETLWEGDGFSDPPKAFRVIPDEEGIETTPL